MKVSRRKFIAGASVGAVAVGVGVGVPVAISAKGGQAKSPAKPAATGSDPLMLYVTNPASGNVEILVGSKAVKFHDPDLVARLFNAAQ